MQRRKWTITLAWLALATLHDKICVWCIKVELWKVLCSIAYSLLRRSLVLSHALGARWPLPGTVCVWCGGGGGIIIPWLCAGIPGGLPMPGGGMWVSGGAPMGEDMVLGGGGVMILPPVLCWVPPPMESMPCCERKVKEALRRCRRFRCLHSMFYVNNRSFLAGTSEDTYCIVYEY